MLLTYNELCKLVETGAITGVHPDHINGASIDVTLGDIVYQESARGSVVRLYLKEGLPMQQADLSLGPIRMTPGAFMLASTRETFNLPNDIAIEYKLKSSLARNGMNHALAGWAIPVGTAVH
jgi:deoxycytidine triphosphate deaminase